MQELNEELAAAGGLVDAQGLDLPGQARVVQAGEDGAPEVTDGPFSRVQLRERPVNHSR
jgi:hypothetical protein